MRLIKPSVEIIPQAPGLEGVYQQIELAGRTCYHSQDRITEDSAREFVNRMIKSGHGAMLEFGTVYLKCVFKRGELSSNIAYELWDRYKGNKYSVALQVLPTARTLEGYIAITTNYRVLIENNWLYDLQHICEPTEHNEKRVTVKFICDRGVSHKKFVA